MLTRGPSPAATCDWRSIRLVTDRVVPLLAAGGPFRTGQAAPTERGMDS